MNRPSHIWEVADVRRQTLWERLTPPQLLLSSFVLLILFGTIGLMVLPLYTGEPLSWLDALFTATSAVCVTGLIVVDTATYFNGAGQLFILLLIQLGALGFITLASLIIVALGRRFSLRHHTLATDTVDVAPHISSRRLVIDIVRFTFLFEAIGAGLLFLFWLPTYPWPEALWHAVFQAVSAFCNAGFSTFTTSLMRFQEEPFILGVVMVLIVLGGIGFLTLEEGRMWWQARKREQRFRLSLHSRLVVATSAVLIAGGWLFFALFEWSVTLEGLPVWAKLENALFASITPRTAGFNTIDYTQTTDSTNLLTIILMFFGGSPGATAGGIKTTTVALIALLAWARLRGRTHVNAWDRTVPEETLQRAVGLFVLAISVVTISVFLLTAVEIGDRPHTETGGVLLTYLFEAYSAFSTVGLSMGGTETLSSPGKWTIIVLMFLGRIGPLAFAAAVAQREPGLRDEYRFAYEDVVVG